MSSSEGVSRREFVATVGGAAVGAAVAGTASANAQAKRRYAIVGTGDRGSGMWGRRSGRTPDLLEFVGLCDINPLRVEAARKRMGVDRPTFTNFDEMIDQTKPELLMVTTVDAFHSEYIVRGLDRGLDVMTEKPMIIDERSARRSSTPRAGPAEDHRHVQLPYAPAHRPQGDADDGRDRPDHLRRFQLVSRT